MKWAKKKDETGVFYTADVMLRETLLLDVIVTRSSDQPKKWGYDINTASGKCIDSREHLNSAAEAKRKAEEDVRELLLEAVAWGTK